MNILTAVAEDIKRRQAFEVAANNKKEKPATLCGANGWW